MEGTAGLAELRRLGARSVPVVSRGDKFVFAQVIKDVVDFLGLHEDTGPKLSPSELHDRYAHVLDTAIRLTRQMPDDQLERELPNRPRSWRVLMHHVFQIPTAFLDMEDSGAPMTYENMVAPPPEDLRSSAAIAGFGERLRSRFDAWWQRAGKEDFTRQITVYFGQTSRHEMFERTVWHSTQHVRQVASLLDQAGVAPDHPLTAADIAGLPLTEKIWDEV
jgi:hypothetical protein